MKLAACFSNHIDITFDYGVTKIATAQGRPAILVPDQLRDLITALLDHYGRDLYWEEQEMMDQYTIKEVPNE